MTTGMPDFGALLAQAQAMQEQMMAAQESLGDQRATGTSGGGLVRATVDGRGDLLALSIEPAAFDPDDPDGLETLADLVVAAVRDARSAAEQMAGESLSQATGGLAALGGSLGELFGAGAGSGAGGEGPSESSAADPDRDPDA
jgi:nucleoid-associated protein EbfC